MTLVNKHADGPTQKTFRQSYLFKIQQRFTWALQLHKQSHSTDAAALSSNSWTES